MYKTISILLMSVCSLLAAMASGQETASPSVSPAKPAAVGGAPVRIVSVTLYRKGVEKTAQAVDREGAAGADLTLLTETWLGEPVFTKLDDPALATMAALAKKHHMYIVSPIHRSDGDKVYNSALLFDREGKLAGMYNKVYPVMPFPPALSREFKGVDLVPGNDAVVFDTDFGRIGMTICFDAQFPEVWQRLEDKGAQLVLFSSAYSAGRSLDAYATLHHYYIVSSIWTGECQAFDITGEKLLEESKGVSRITLDFGRRIFHNDVAASYNVFYHSKYEKLRKENPGIAVDKWCDREGWHVLRPTQPGVDVSVLAKRYGVPELREFINDQRRRADDVRGSQFKPARP